MGIQLDALENVLSEKRLSQADLARRAGLSAHTIGRAVRDKAPLSETSANKIAGALRVRVDALRSNPAATSDTDFYNRYTDPRRIKQEMVRNGMNPTELAAKTGLSLATVSSVIRGTRQPQQQTVEKIAGVLGEDIMGGYSEPLATRAASIEIRAKAGQRRTVLYPEDGLETGPTDDRTTPSAGDQESGVEKPVEVPAAVGVVDAVEETPEEQQQGRSTLDELYSHVQQSRRMVTALLEHVGAIEEHIRQAVAAGTRDENGRG